MHYRATSALALAGVVAGMGAGAAQARATNVVTAIKAQDQMLSKSPAYQQIKNFKLTSVAQAKAVIPEFTALNVELKAAAATVSKASTSSTQQKQGQTDWVAAVGDLTTGVSDVETGLKDLVAHKAAAGKVAFANANQPLAHATALDKKADKLLGLPSSD